MTAAAVAAITATQEVTCGEDYRFAFAVIIFAILKQSLHQRNIDALESVRWAMPGKDLWMDEMCQQFRSFHNSQCGAREIRICVNGVDASGAHRGQIEEHR